MKKQMSPSIEAWAAGKGLVALLKTLQADRGADRALLERLEDQHGRVLAALDEAMHRAAEQGNPAAQRAPRRRNAPKKLVC